ncbi:MAG: N-acetylneuraminate synthase [Phycisphaerae bacterium]|nr:N-acetylneuraminate synthase [Phycisphaerae bacterium]
MNASINIGDRCVGGGHRAFIVAEAGVNHNGRLETALELVKAAADSGADAVKFQTFKTEELVTRALEKAPYQAGNTGGGSQFDMIKKLELDEESHHKLKNACDDLGVTFLSTPFYEGGVDLLADMKVSAIKVDSGNLTNFPLLRYIAHKGLPVILSTGMSSLGDVEEAVGVLRGEGADICLLHCTSNYPARFEDVHLRAMETLRRAFDCPVGYSDHTPGPEVSIAAVALGANLIEKHFTLDRNAEGPDHKASLEVHELALMIREIRNVESALGRTIKKVNEDELSTIRALRRSLVALTDIKKGTLITRSMLAVKRPGDGIQPKHIELVVGRTARQHIKADEKLTWDDI